MQAKKLKKTNTLFHSCKKYSSLKGILKDGGFKASYSDEKIDGYDVKTLMVSFSNVVLFESESQINYGEYSIGLTKDWGIKNCLEPVIYTYDNSITGKTFMENLKIAGRMKVAECKNDPDLDEKMTAIFDNSINYLEYLKSYIVRNKKGEEFIAYNDREWRFVYKDGIEKYNPLIFKRNFLTNVTNSDYERHKPFDKPYTNNIVISYSLSDLKFVVVDKKSEKKQVYDILYQNYGKENVLNHIESGNLEILSREAVWNNI